MIKKEEFMRAWRKYAAVALASAIVLAPLAPVAPALAAQTTNIESMVAAKSISFRTNENTNVLIIGKTYKLTSVLTPSTADESVKYTSSNKAIATVGLTTGKVTPKKAGKVKITATTKSGAKKTIEFLAINKHGTTASQASINKLLAANNATKITIRNLTKESNYIIKDGDYSKKTLVVNAPLSEVTNSGTFKAITLKDVKNGTFIEKGKNNSFKIIDKEFSFVASAEAIIKKLAITAEKAIANITVNGTLKDATISGAGVKANFTIKGTLNNATVTGKDTNLKLTQTEEGNVEKLVLKEKTDIVLTGTDKKVEFVVEESAKGSTLESSVPVAVSAGAEVKVTLKKGAEGSTLEKTNPSVKLEVENNTTEEVKISTEGSSIVETVTPDTSTDSGDSSDNNNNNNNNNNDNTDSNTPITSTVVGIASEDGKTATFTLPVAISNLSSATVELKGTINKSYGVSGTEISAITKLLSNESQYAEFFKGLEKYTYNKGGKVVTVTGTAGSSTKVITYDEKSFNVTLNNDGTITASKVGSDTTYLIAKDGFKKLIITSNTNTNVADIVTFTVTY